MTLKPTPKTGRSIQLLLPVAILLSAYACRKEESTTTLRSETQTFSGNLAVKQTDGLSNACTGCYVADAGLAADSSAETSSFLSVVAADSAFVQQRLEFAKAGKQGDNIRLLVALPEGQTDRSLLENVQLAAGDVNTLAQDRRSAISSGVTLQQISAGKFLASWVASQPYDRVEVRLLGVTDGLQGLHIYYAQRQSN